ncbi:50S ribosomal protein L25 [Dehalococcoidia bacterium]|nr:50S ribosomal protein L25 [Dehalococcoidia bacterium]
MDVHSVKLSPRTQIGKKVSVLRRQGLVPVHVYGAEIESAALQVEGKTLVRLLAQVGTNVPVSVEYDGRDEENICFVREVQRHPVTEEIIHVDFLRVDVSQKISAAVPVILDGTAPGVAQLGGVLLQNLQSLLVEALPMEMPAAFHVDITLLADFEKTIVVGDVATTGDVTILNDPEEMIARVTPPRIEVVEIAAEELEEGQEVDKTESLPDSDGAGAAETAE